MLFSSNHYKRIIRTGPSTEVPRCPIIRIRNIPVWAICLHIKIAVYEKPQPAIGTPALHRDVMPLII